MRLNVLSVLLVIAGFVVISGPSVSGAPEAEGLRNLLEEKHPYVVTIRAVIKQEISGAGSSQSNEMKRTLRGVLIDEQGTILTSSTAFSSRSRSFQGQSIRMENTPKQLNVILEGESEEKNAFLGAKDGRFGLAFLQLRNPDEVSFESLDLDSSTTPAVGEQVVWVSRKSKTFDYAPYFSVTRINGSISKPRDMWAMEGPPSSGLPVFTPDGSLLGITVRMQTDDGSSRQAMLRSLLGSGSGGGGLPNFLMPMSDLKNVLRRARKQIKKTRKKIQQQQEKEKTDSADGNSGEKTGEDGDE